jgi:arylsulfatase A-like enzyme
MRTSSRLDTLASMTKRRTGLLLGCALCLWLAAGEAAWGGQSDRPSMNILLISLDTVRADALTFRDPEVARHMTALAARGTVFTQAISGTSWTLPSHAQMFTGMPLALHGVDADDVRIDPLTPILPEYLKQAGYFTGGVFSVRYLWNDYGFGRGFDVYRSAVAESDLERRDLDSAP